LKVKKGDNKMKKIANMSLVFTLAFLLGFGGLVYAESSGNFSAKINTTQCTIDNATGGLVGGIPTTTTFLKTTIRTPNSGSTALVIRPSLVTGLYTKTKVSETVTADTAYAGLQVRVLIDGKVVAPGTPVGMTAGAEDGWVYYDKRWQQINQNFLNQITACTDNTSLDCSLELILSTLSAHSMDFVVGDVGGGLHTLEVQWRFEDSDGTGGNAAACVGPGVLTVQQVKTFSTGSGIDIE
jgi:hypothetical protein